MKQPEEILGTSEEINRESARRTRRSFLAGGVAAAAGYGLWRAAQAGAIIGRQPVTFRRTFQADAAITRTLFNERGLSPTYPLSRATDLRLNGTVGLAQVLKPESWRLQLVGADNPSRFPQYSPDVTAWNYEYAGAMGDDAAATDVKSAPGNGATSKTGANTLNPTGATSSDAGAALAARIEAMVNGQAKKPHLGSDEAGPSANALDRHTPGLLLTMADLQKLPQIDLVTEFKCIEGWSQVVHWSGVRLRDLIEAYPPAKVTGPTSEAADPPFVYMETPDGNYYGGYDMSACLHPQSLLVTHMAGQPLTQAHGAPLRLHMPIKYGYKQLKRIGLIAYTRTRPDDYWTKLGYDWYAGL